MPEPQIYEFYARLSDAINIPVMIQDAPASGTVLSAAFLARMAREIWTLLEDEVRRSLLEKG